MKSLALLAFAVLYLAVFQVQCSQKNRVSSNLNSNTSNTNNVATSKKGLPPINLELSKNDQYLVYYDTWDDNKIASVRNNFKVIIIHPGNDATQISSAQIEKLKNGNSTKVFGYLTIGEDDTCSGDEFKETANKLKCAREKLPYNDKSGPVVLSNGTRKLQKNGYPSYLVDRNGDKEPDINEDWQSFYIDAGNESWKKLVLERAAKVANLGVDGFFLDTIDTAQDFKESRSGMLDLISQLKTTNFNNKQMILIANRGLFFFKKGQCEICNSVSAVMFENLFTSQCLNKGDECKEASSGMEASFTTNGNGEALSDLRGVQTEYPNLRVLVLEYIGRKQKEPPCQELLNGTLDKLTKGITITSVTPNFSYDGRYPYYIAPGELNTPQGGIDKDYFPIFTSNGKLDYKNWCK
jgi:endo-alpha-1,4-polygalactosaminidase (GH114 family)